MQSVYENYIGEIIRGRRMELGLNAVDVYSGICGEGVYNKIERGKYAGGIHVLRALCERLGINSDRCGIYIAKAEYDELMERLYILEDIRDGRLDRAEERVAGYDKKYGGIPLNSQFATFMRGRLAELRGNDEKALEYYDNAIQQTMPGYENRESISCMTVSEAYMIFGVARIKRKLGGVAEAYKLYMLLLEYCMSFNVEKWNLVCIYPKLICEMADVIGIDKMDAAEMKDMLEHCENALNVLVGTARLHYIRPVLRNIIRFKRRLENDDDDVRDYEELLRIMEEMFKRYGHERELFEWYPYYVGCEFFCVNDFIAERRIMQGMSIEELAGNRYSARNVQRIVKGHVAPSYNTSKGLLDRLGLKGVMRSDVVVGNDIELYKLWDETAFCIKSGDFEGAEKKYEKLSEMPDGQEELNRRVLEYIRIKLDVNERKTDTVTAAERLEKLLPFSIRDVKKYNNFTKLEEIILCDYLYWKKDMKTEEWLELFDGMASRYGSDELTRRRFASVYEGICAIGSNYLGDSDEFAKSDETALNGIRIEMECERMNVLPSLLYSLAWNKEKQGRVTENEVRLCRYAYAIAKHKNDGKRAETYKNWLKRNEVYDEAQD